MKRITAKNCADVWLTTSLAQWNRFPFRVKQVALDGLERVGTLRAQIAADSKVQEMPPVEVACEIWGDYRSRVCGHACLLGNRFGARLPVSTATARDEVIVRRLLVHEFSHCFFLVMQAVRASLSGTEFELPINPNTDDEDAHDRTLMIDASEWFCEADALNFMYRNDADLGPALDDSFLWWIDYVSTTSPDAHPAPGGRVKIPPGLFAHAKAIIDRASAAQAT
jgi:hypothetical protein